MEGSHSADQLAGDDRAYLEDALARLAASGHIPSRGEREVTFRIDEHGRVRWWEARRIRAPGSELEAESEREPDI